MHRKVVLLSLLLIISLLLSSCALLPEEETIRTAPMIRPYVREAFKTTPVMRGDLIERAKVACRYVPVQSASLSFSLGGEYIDRVMVKVGDTVEEGQLLAQLQLGNLEERIETARNAISELELRYAHLQELYELDLRRSEITSAKLAPKEQQEAALELQEDYAVRTRELTDALELQKLTLAALEKSLADRQIRAPFSGTVTHVTRYKEGDMSSFGTGVLSLVDSTMSLFKATTEHWERFQLGEEYEIVVNKVPYLASVTNETDLGLPPEERVPGKKANVYFALTNPSFELEDGDSGSIELVLSEHPDVLYIPEKALSLSSEQPIVYYQREDGMKAYKSVEIGVTIDNYTEIISGLEEGDLIITD